MFIKTFTYSASAKLRSSAGCLKTDVPVIGVYEFTRCGII
ncbi:hypothetical protein HMPREF9098_1681 [Kingella denitrificans ATCC 33394]|uniref:Uncharacterized protein n=1 Tax=Kingella denitrificans ATCC 33394 TaxID=888741 RepID=F0F0P6_9NEIS|nr:hypothetical protein HMPREF9098_1681 [Kingella denitrificans ATCC 33394]